MKTFVPPIVNRYVDHLKSLEIGDSQKNSRIRSACSLYETCVENVDFEAYVKAIDFSYRFSESVKRRRAPDKCVMEALDRAFFDLSSEGIPMGIRLIYLLLRLIPNRISEVLAISLECISYPDLGVFSISIPTAKETPLHVPLCTQYSFAMDGKIENIFYRLLRMQQATVRSYAAREELDTDYLLFDPSRGRVLTSNDFNAFLADFIHDHHILGADGNCPIVTSHHFRHACISERLRSGIYSPEQTMKEANHSNVDVTLSYGYLSEHDEAEHLGEISSVVLSNDLQVTVQDGSMQHKKINPAKYGRLQNDTAFTRVIPGFGLCCNAKCNPQYEKCVECSCFLPDKLYHEYFTEARDIVQKRLMKFMRGRVSPEAVAFERNQLRIIDAYIAKMAAVDSLNGSVICDFNDKELAYGSA